MTMNNLALYFWFGPLEVNYAFSLMHKRGRGRMPLLQNCPWFLECPLTFHHLKEKDERAEVGIVLGEDNDYDIVDAPMFH